MREIKFRSWDLEKKCMFYDVEEFYDGLGYGFDKPDPTGCQDCFSDFLNSEHQIVMQYTGLKDKNGKEIYEGDIVQFDKENAKVFPKPTMPVIFDYGAFYVGKYTVLLLSTTTEVIDIIGNIYENPKLIVKEEADARPK